MTEDHVILQLSGERLRCSRASFCQPDRQHLRGVLQEICVVVDRDVRAEGKQNLLKSRLWFS